MVMVQQDDELIRFENSAVVCCSLVSVARLEAEGGKEARKANPESTRVWVGKVCCVLGVGQGKKNASLGAPCVNA